LESGVAYSPRRKRTLDDDASGRTKGLMPSMKRKIAKDDEKVKYVYA